MAPCRASALEPPQRSLVSFFSGHARLALSLSRHLSPSLCFVSFRLHAVSLPCCPAPLHVWLL